MAGFAQSDPNKIKNFLLKQKSDYDINNQVIFGNDCSKKPIAYIVAAIIIIPVLPVYISITIIRKKVSFNNKNKKHLFSTSCRIKQL